MKTGIKKLLIALSFLMIASQAISQTKLINGEQELTCYSNEEQRIIATILLEGEECKEVVEVQRKQILEFEAIKSNYEAIIIDKNRTIAYTENTINIMMEVNASKNQQLLEKDNELDKLKRNNKTKNKLLGGSLILNIGLIVLLVL